MLSNLNIDLKSIASDPGVVYVLKIVGAWDIHGRIGSARRHAAS